ncbi:MAG: MFS transporter [Kofleriaceae bacterium]|nr:MFS transporter [Kofleriaceae bacterium]
MSAAIVRSLVPARMDRLPWSSFHWRVVVALGITWVLEGVEIGLASAVGGILSNPEHRGATLNFGTATVGYAGAVYLIGEVAGALYFGRKADKLGRRRLFIVTLALYLIANGVTALSFTPAMFLVTRFFAGMGIGGEYAAIHSAIDELTPAKYRGRVDIAIAGTYWGGAMLAAGAQFVLLDPTRVPVNWGWRLALLIGPVIGFAIWPLRKYIPESPRWQLTHGHAAEAEATVDRIEAELRAQGIELAEVNPEHAIVIEQRPPVSIRFVAKTLFRKYPRRFVLGATLMITQSFLYNAIFFTYVLILEKVYGVASGSTAYYFFPFAAGNLLGPLLLGRFFDTIGRRTMIALTYCSSAVLLALSGWLFAHGHLTAQTQTILWCATFFIASAAASSAYLTTSEIFPVEIRAQAISFIFSIAQCVGAVGAAVFGAVIAAATKEMIVDGQVEVVVADLTPLAVGYVAAAVIMFTGGVVAWFLGIDAEQKSLEDVATPLTAVESPHVTPIEVPEGPHPPQHRR